ncbi:MAG: hypothetical protein AABW90_03180 [Nanoarchaeota archaeon]
MNKKATNTLLENLVFILLVIVFISIMYFAITRAGSQSILYEQIYAKQIALMIDKAKPGMEFELDTFEMQRIARKNNFLGNLVNIDNDKNKVNVKLIDGNGYNYYFFNDVNVVWNLKKDERKLILEIVNRQTKNNEVIE